MYYTVSYKNSFENGHMFSASTENITFISGLSACYATINQLEIKREVILLRSAFCIINFRDAHVACVAIHYLHINSDFNSARCDLTLG